jgi:hypothetical protein
MTTIMPPLPQRTTRFRPLIRLVGHLTYAGGLCCTVMSSALMLTSAGVSGAAWLSMSVGDGLRQRAIKLLTISSPASAVIYRARETFYARRRQGIALD